MRPLLGLRPYGWSARHSYSYARSAEFIHSPIMQTLVWARVPGDLVFSVGVFTFAWFMVRAFLPGKVSVEP